MPTARTRIISGLLDGYFMRNGATVSTAGTGYLGVRAHAVNVPWWEAVCDAATPKVVGEWLDALAGQQPFDGALESQRLNRFLSDQNPQFSARLATHFAGYERAYGAWRDTENRLVLSIAILVPLRAAAKAWGRAFDQQAIYSLKESSIVWLQEPCAAS